VILIAGEATEASVRALVDASRRLGLPAFPVADAGALDRSVLAGASRVGLTAGEFSPDGVVEAIAVRLETER
jgi:4-hydroxy-3-methylbut-2-enyl diphosphate reductase IspH